MYEVAMQIHFGCATLQLAQKQNEMDAFFFAGDFTEVGKAWNSANYVLRWAAKVASKNEWSTKQRMHQTQVFF